MAPKTQQGVMFDWVTSSSAAANAVLAQRGFVFKVVISSSLMLPCACFSNRGGDQTPVWKSSILTFPLAS